MKRTTLALDERVLEAVREKARIEKRKLQDCVNELLRLGLAVDRAERRPPLPLPVYSMGAANVELADRNALEALMEER